MILAYFLSKWAKIKKGVQDNSCNTLKTGAGDGTRATFYLNPLF